MVLEATNLVKHYGDFAALKGLNLSIDAGEVFCLLGANGAGKTTTIQLFLGFIEPTSGSAKIKGLEVKDNPLETKRHLAYIPENVMLYPNLTGIENLSYFSTLAGCASTDDATLRATLLRAGLPEDAVERPVGNYSKGMRQKVGIAMAIAAMHRCSCSMSLPQVWTRRLPTSFPSFVASLRDEGVAVLMATHDLFRSREIASRIGIMKRGELVDQFKASDVSHNDLERIYLQHMHD